ncbi:hypothetical protein ABZZ80_19245, partial [Streptomyces sp. NPDC006356]
IGTALLNTLATTSSPAYITAHLTDPAAVTLHVQVAEAVRAGDAVRAEHLTREITMGALQELDILAP